MIRHIDLVVGVVAEQLYSTVIIDHLSHVSCHFVHAIFGYIALFS